MESSENQLVSIYLELGYGGLWKKPRVAGYGEKRAPFGRFGLKLGWSRLLVPPKSAEKIVSLV